MSVDWGEAAARAPRIGCIARVPRSAAACHSPAMTGVRRPSEWSPSSTTRTRSSSPPRWDARIDAHGSRRYRQHLRSRDGSGMRGSGYLFRPRVNGNSTVVPERHQVGRHRDLELVRLHPALQRPRCILIGTSNHPTMPSTATSCCDRSPRGLVVMSS
jgi:hypothetical protein